MDPPAGGVVEVGVDEDPVAGGVDARVGTPAGAGEGGAAQLAAGGADGPDAVGEVFAVGVAHGEHGDVLGAVAVGVFDRGGGERLAGVARGGRVRVPSRARCGWPGWRRGRRPGSGRGRRARLGGVGGGSPSSTAAGMSPCSASRSSSAARPPAATDWAWRASPTHHSWAPGVAATASRRAAASRVPTWDTSSTITVVCGCERRLAQLAAEPGDGVGVEAGGAQFGDRLVGGRHRDDGAAGGLAGGGGGVHRGGLAVARPAPSTPAPPGPRRTGRGPRRPGRRPAASVRRRSHRVDDRLRIDGHRPAGRASSRRASRRSSTARSSTVDHSGGPAARDVGGEPHDQLRRQEPLATAPTMSSTVSRPPDSAATRSTTWASPNRDSVAHSPVAGSTSAANISPSVGRRQRFELAADHQVVDAAAGPQADRLRLRRPSGRGAARG